MISLSKITPALAQADHEAPPIRYRGIVSRASLDSYSIRGFSSHVRLGELVTLAVGDKREMAQIILVGHDEVLVKPLENGTNIGVGTPAYSHGDIQIFPDGSWRGRVLDALARPVDGQGPLACGAYPTNLDNPPPEPLLRQRVTKPVRTGVRAIDIFAPLCVGQRLGIFSNSGVGKSTLLSMLARALSFDVVVVALVGERGREVREFVEDAMGQGADHAVIVVSTSDESAMMRKMAPRTAMSIAEYFRDQGQSVLYLLDSATRFAQATRDSALSSGEPAIARGYTPSVFAELARLFERAGPGAEGAGSITAIISVLGEGENGTDPLSDIIRGVLDGHIMLERHIAEQGRYPAIDPLKSVSRLARVAWTEEEEKNAMQLHRLISRFEETKDLRLIGGYTPGQDLELDNAVQLVPRIYEILQQTPTEAIDPAVDPFKYLGDSLYNAATA